MCNLRENSIRYLRYIGIISQYLDLRVRFANHFHGVARSFELFSHKQRNGKVYRFLFHTVYAYGPAVFPTVPCV